MIDIGVNENIVQKGGAWFSYKDTNLGQGRENSKIYLKDNPEIALEIENQIREKYNLTLIQTAKLEGIEETLNLSLADS